MTDLSLTAHVVATVAMFVAAAVNAVAGGGTLISFPVLTALGMPSLNANATNIVSLGPGSATGAYAQRDDLDMKSATLRWHVVLAVLGGVVGSGLLLLTPESTFRGIVPFLVLLSVALLGAQDRLRSRVARSDRLSSEALHTAESIAVFLTACYGGYFGAGLGIMFLASLRLFSPTTFHRANAVKQALSGVVSVSAVVLLAASNYVDWHLVAILMPSSLVGGWVGGRFVTRLDPVPLRRLVMVIGLTVAVIYAVH